MINELRIKARPVEAREAVQAQAEPRSIHKHGIGGALLGATWFGAAFPLAVGAMSTAAGAADMAVYAASGVLFGAVSGGTLGAVIGGRGR